MLLVRVRLPAACAAWKLITPVQNAAAKGLSVRAMVEVYATLAP